ncbi:unnamed protein product, partial [Didymodactylos carnosus]
LVNMAMHTNDDSDEIQMDSESEDDDEMEIDEIYSSDVDSSESDDELAPREQSINRKWTKTAFEPHLCNFDEESSGISSRIRAM